MTEASIKRRRALPIPRCALAAHRIGRPVPTARRRCIVSNCRCSHIRGVTHLGPDFLPTGKRSISPATFLACMSASHRCSPARMAASDQALPSSVRGPVLRPPWNRHRVFPGTGHLRNLHALRVRPLGQQKPRRWRTRAPQRCLSFP